MFFTLITRSLDQEIEFGSRVTLRKGYRGYANLFETTRFSTAIALEMYMFMMMIVYGTRNVTQSVLQTPSIIEDFVENPVVKECL